MIAYKFLSASGHGRFSELYWPVPEGDEPGAWLSAGAPLRPCVRGIHAARVEKLPYWLDLQLWEIELAGALVETESALVAERGRLLRRIEGWNEAARAALCSFCKERTDAMLARVSREVPSERERASFYADEVEMFVREGAYATAVYVAAVGAHVASTRDPEAAYRAERAAQADFVAKYLGIG